MDNQKTLFFVGAHPDDETFGIGGTLAHYASLGVKVYYLCGTRGDVGVADPEFMKGYGVELPFSEMQMTRRTLYNVYLFLIMVIECAYRQYPTQDQENWARQMLAIEMEKLA